MLFYILPVLIRISLRGDRFALSSQIILIVFIVLLINSEMYEKLSQKWSNDIFGIITLIK